VIISSINICSFVAESEGFGINTDLFETNILNLAVVIGVLIYYGRITFAVRFVQEFIFNACLIS
jgi:hypothetical protein